MGTEDTHSDEDNMTSDRREAGSIEVTEPRTGKTHQAHITEPETALNSGDEEYFIYTLSPRIPMESDHHLVLTLHSKVNVNTEKTVRIAIMLKISRSFYD